MSAATFYLGDWLVDPATNCVRRDGEQRQMEPRAMDVLVALSAQPGEVVTSNSLLETCWGSNIGGDNPVHKTIAQLRKVLGDSPGAPRYIETIRKRGYRTVAALVRASEPAAAGGWLTETPFRGLAPFEERHSAVFFGRADATETVLRAIERQSAAGCAMVLLLGPSGSGKTSLIRAGVLARLAGDNGAARANPGIGNNLYLDCADLADGAMQALASVLLDAEREAGGAPLFEQDSAATLAQRMSTQPDSVIAALADGARSRGARTALFIDRFEALLRDSGPARTERAAMLELLVKMARNGAVLVLLACRNDFYPQLACHPALMDLKQSGGHVDLAPPSGADIAQMVRQPARAAGLRFGVRDLDGAALDDELCAAARGSPDTLPLLQYCLEELYRQRSDDGELRFEVYQSLGGIEGAIGARAEQVLLGLSGAQKAALPQVLALLVQVADDALAVTARPAPWSALATPAAGELVRALVEARLFTSTLHAGTAVFGIAHEALLRRWPRVVEWINRHREALQVRTRIAAQAARWDAHGRSRDLLLPAGLQARQARELRDDAALGVRSDALTGAYIRASLRRIRRGERLRLAVLGVVLLLASLAVLLSITAHRAQREAEQHRTEAEELMSFMLGDFVERLRPLGRLDLLDSVSARALRYLADGRIEAGGGSLAQRAKALQVLSEVKMARGDGAGAEAALLLGRTILERQLAAAPQDTALLKSAGANAFWLGQLHYDRSDWGAARAYFTQYRMFADRQAASAPHDPDGVLEQSYAHSSLGSAALDSGDIATAVDEFARSVSLKTALLARSPGKDSLAADLANSLSWQASAQARLGHLDEAMAILLREAAIIGRLHAGAPDNASFAQRYSFSLFHQGELLEARGRLAEARDHYSRAVAPLRPLVAHDPSNKEVQAQLNAMELAVLASTDEAAAAPPADFAAWAALQQRFDKAAAQQSARHKLARIAAQGRVAQARVQLRHGRRAAASALLAEAVPAVARVRAALPADAATAATYAHALLLQARLAEAPTLRQSLCEQASGVLAKAAAHGADYVVVAPWVLANTCAGTDAQVAPQRKLLDSMGYQDVHYLHDLQDLLELGAPAHAVSAH